MYRSWVYFCTSALKCSFRTALVNISSPAIVLLNFAVFSPWESFLGEACLVFLHPCQWLAWWWQSQRCWRSTFEKRSISPELSYEIGKSTFMSRVLSSFSSCCDCLWLRPMAKRKTKFNRAVCTCRLGAVSTLSASPGGPANDAGEGDGATLLSLSSKSDHHLSSGGWGGYWHSQSWCQAGARGWDTCSGSSQSRAPCFPPQSPWGLCTWL